jgi:hypothetical protein
MHAVRHRFWAEAGLAVVNAVLVVLTIVWPAWIERAFGVDPDRASGSLEWLLIALTLGLSVAFCVGAGIEWRHAAPESGRPSRHEPG